jgi:hypothetical protein
MVNIKSGTEQLKKFGFVMGSAFFVIYLLIIFKHKQGSSAILAISTVFFILAIISPVMLKPVYITWMSFASISGWINSRLILLIIYYLLMTPINLLMRLFGREALEKKFDKKKESYWRKKEQNEFSLTDYERQF